MQLQNGSGRPVNRDRVDALAGAIDPDARNFRRANTMEPDDTRNLMIPGQTAAVEKLSCIDDSIRGTSKLTGPMT